MVIKIVSANTGEIKQMGYYCYSFTVLPTPGRQLVSYLLFFSQWSQLLAVRRNKKNGMSDQEVWESQDILFSSLGIAFKSREESIAQTLRFL